MSEPVIVADKIGKLVPLIFVSDQPGEVFSAVQALRRIIEASGCDAYCLSNIVSAALTERGPAPRSSIRPPWQDLAGECLRRGGYQLKKSERDFLSSMKHWRGQPTERQQAWLDAIAEALNVGRAAA